MIYNHQLNSLSEEEYGLLLLILTEYPKTSNLVLDKPHVLSYKKEYLKAKLEYAATKIKEEYRNLIENIKVKLDIK